MPRLILKSSFSFMAVGIAVPCYAYCPLPETATESAEKAAAYILESADYVGFIETRSGKTEEGRREILLPILTLKGETEAELPLGPMPEILPNGEIRILLTNDAYSLGKDDGEVAFAILHERDGYYVYSECTMSVFERWSPPDIARAIVRQTSKEH
ncbi:MAG: hypothetical protein V2I43_17580 [Parvularcula sp.]|jgi:hypothetical protein|nr:hypothetical protein [Parvularcula sp.]